LKDQNTHQQPVFRPQSMSFYQGLPLVICLIHYDEQKSARE